MQEEGELPPLMQQLQATLVYTIGSLVFAEEQLRAYGVKVGNGVDEFINDFESEMEVVAAVLRATEQAKEVRQ